MGMSLQRSLVVSIAYVRSRRYDPFLEMHFWFRTLEIPPFELELGVDWIASREALEPMRLQSIL